MRKFTTITVIAAVATLLAGCQSPPEPPGDDGSCVPTHSGAASDLIVVSGAGTASPTMRFSDLPQVHTTQRTIVRQGQGRTAEPGTIVTFNYSVVSADTGEAIDTVGYDGQHAQAIVGDETLQQGVMRAIRCSTEGSRIAAVIPASEAFGSFGADHYGISGSDTVVMVIDVVGVAAERADGQDQQVDPDLPTVDLGGTGEPRITIPPTVPPKALQTVLLKRGEGEAVEEGAVVTLKYVGVVWQSGRVFDSTWYQEPVVQHATSSFIDGFEASLVGVPVGSQVLAVVPPDRGYGAKGSIEFGINATETLVFVIDVLAVVQPPKAQK